MPNTFLFGDDQSVMRNLDARVSIISQGEGMKAWPRVHAEATTAATIVVGPLTSHVLPSGIVADNALGAVVKGDVPTCGGGSLCRSGSRNSESVLVDLMMVDSDGTGCRRLVLVSVALQRRSLVCMNTEGYAHIDHEATSKGVRGSPVNAAPANDCGAQVVFSVSRSKVSMALNLMEFVAKHALSHVRRWVFRDPYIYCLCRKNPR
ncbi:hypothetical protein NE237_001537 [Protea cynaroides]|uniref:Uncharacterized protein n=1 Tax=Protea cynaroides TaxID=273540 RepID=A0A9Q0KUC6_9MAGN|nr:hypothetical protein NE237_001537 [Protea cynaroides]